jgi:hypothetical protein
VGDDDDDDDDDEDDDDDDDDDDDGNFLLLVACGFFVSWVMLRILSSLSTGVGEQQELVVAVWRIW